MQWHQLDHIQTICTSLQTDNHQHLIIQFLRPDALPDAQPTVSKLGMLTRLESLESRFFFSIPGKEFLDFRESTLVIARQQAYRERDNCNQSLRDCYQSIACCFTAAVARIPDARTPTPRNKEQWRI